MKLPRMSIKALVGVVLLVALDCATVISLFRRPAWIIEDLILPVIGCLPMANLLAIAGALVIQREGRARAFWLGFVGVGSVSLIAAFFWLDEAYSWLLQASSLFEWMESTRAGWWFELVVILPSTCLAVQLPLTVAGGWIARKLVSRWVPLVSDQRRNRHSTTISTAVFLVLAVVPFVTIEGYLRQAVDPKIVRLPVASVAVFNNGFNLDLSKRTTGNIVGKLKEGTKVKVLADHLLEVVAEMGTLDGAWESIDMRDVEALVLDGDEEGKIVMIPRYFLRSTK